MMKRYLTILLAPAFILSSPLSGQEQNSALEQARANFEELVEDLKEPLGAFDQRYEMQLRELLEKARTSSDLSFVLEIQHEIDKFRNGETELSKNPDLKRLQSIYSEHSAKLRAEYATKLQSLREGYLAGLQKLQDQLTRESKIDEAMRTKEVADRLAKIMEEEALETAISNKRTDQIDEDAEFFNGRFYKFYSTPSTWEEADKQCRRQGGMLACAPDLETNTFLHELAGRNRIWLGGSDEKREGDWQWEDRSKFDWTNWAGGEPNNSGNEDHIALWYGGRWNDEKGRSTRLGYVCMWIVD